MKLSRELSKRGTGRTLYILDEPTTGLHFEDVRKLLDVLNRLVDQGNTIVVIEHNLDVIKIGRLDDRSGPRGRRGRAAGWSRRGRRSRWRDARARTPGTFSPNCSGAAPTRARVMPTQPDGLW